MIGRSQRPQTRWERFAAWTAAYGMIELDADGNVSSWNPGAERIFGYAPGDILGEHISCLYPSRDGCANHPERLLDRARNGGTTEEGWCVCADGSTAWVVVTIAALDAEAGDHGGFLGIVRDPGEDRGHVRRRDDAAAALEEFASAVAHDLKGPLGTVASYLQLLERRYADELDGDAETFIDFAVEATARMQRMIDGLAGAYARVDAAGEPFHPVELNAVVDEAVAALSDRIADRGAELEVGELPTVDGDAAQLQLLFSNLLDNAIKYAGEGPPRVDVAAERDGDRWLVSVADEGIGMDPSVTDSVFDVFRRLHPDDEHDGAGIGLALCDRIAHRHGGEIWAESEPGEGATFTIALPATRS